jgi:outer membrane protein assembly factor BamB
LRPHVRPQRRHWQPIWVDQDLLGNGQGTFGIQPLVANGRVYLASSIGIVPADGILLALNAATGKLVWTPYTILPAPSACCPPCTRAS